jgi:hypothetical protein
MAQDFVSEFDISFPVFTDPKREAYALAGFERGWHLKPSSFTRAVSAFRAGHRQTKTKGDPLQQGGELLIMPSGELLFRRPTEGPGNHTEPEVLQRLIEGLGGVGEEG